MLSDCEVDFKSFNLQIFVDGQFWNKLVLYVPETIIQPIDNEINVFEYISLSLTIRMV